MRFPLVFLGIALITVIGCSPAAPTTPSLPTPIPPQVTGLTINGIPTPIAIGESAQLTASVTLADGVMKQTLNAAWQSSDTTVAMLSTAGVLTVVGGGNVDVTATAYGVSAKSHLFVPYDVNGVIHESAPTQSVALAGASVVVRGGPHDGQTTMSDSAGRFTLRGIEAPGFGVLITKSGYDPASFQVLELPRDARPDIALSPIGTEILTFSGTAFRFGQSPGVHLVNVHTQGSVQIDARWIGGFDNNI